MSTPHNSPAPTSIILPILQRCDGKRLAMAVDGLFAGTLTITLTNISEAGIHASVANGARSYQVALTATGGTCDCPDARHRPGVICKHMIGVALSVPRSRQSPMPPIRHLAWSDTPGVLCGEQAPQRVHRYPWPGTLVQWQDTCTACRAAYANGYQLQAQVSEQIARRPQGAFTPVAPGAGTVQAPHGKGKKAA